MTFLFCIFPKWTLTWWGSVRVSGAVNPGWPQHLLVIRRVCALILAAFGPGLRAADGGDWCFFTRPRWFCSVCASLRLWRTPVLSPGHVNIAALGRVHCGGAFFPTSEVRAQNVVDVEVGDPVQVSGRLEQRQDGSVGFISCISAALIFLFHPEILLNPFLSRTNASAPDFQFFFF